MLQAPEPTSKRDPDRHRGIEDERKVGQEPGDGGRADEPALRAAPEQAHAGDIAADHTDRERDQPPADQAAEP